MRLFAALSVVFITCFFSPVIHAQVKLTGSVKDVRGKAVSFATITLKDADGNITGYSQTGENGSYLITLDNTEGIKELVVNCIGFKQSVTPWVFNKLRYDFVLDDGLMALPEVLVKAKPVLIVTKDTLSYLVNDFSQKGNRTLGDVLKNMPGITVATDGAISYNGKKISNFYIDGDNLLDDRYNLATKTISKDIVSKVQVIQNDQPIKMLRKKTSSENVALNITIKDKAKLALSGQASLGAGFPSKVDGAVDVMMFNKKYKGLNYFTGNNIGIDPGNDLVAHSESDNYKYLNNDNGGYLLSTGTIGAPNLPQNRYLFNKAAMGTINNLSNFGKDIQVKTNISYLLDKQQTNYSKFTQILLPTGKVAYSEAQKLLADIHQVYANANVMINREQVYLNNALKTSFAPTNYGVALAANNTPLNQALSQKTFDISNELNFMASPKSGNIFNFYSYINYFNHPEGLKISPGLNDTLLNNGHPYAMLEQNTGGNSYFTNNFFSVKKLSPALIQSYKLGFSYKYQDLISSLNAIQPDLSKQPVTVDGVNHLNWRHSNLYFEPNYEYHTSDNKFKAVLNLPFNIQNIRYEDSHNQLDSGLNKLQVNPNLYLKYITGKESDFVLSTGFKNRLGTAVDVYRGAILKDYRDIYANDAPVSHQSSASAVITFTGRKAAEIFFYDLTANYSVTNYNTISSFVITKDLLQKVILPYKNAVKSYSFSGNVSKYLFGLRTVVNAGLNWTKSMSNQIQNQVTLPYTSTGYGLKGSFKSKVSSKITFNYAIDFNRNTSKNAAVGESQRYDYLFQQSELSLNMIKNIFINFKAEHLYAKQVGMRNQSYLFSDLILKYQMTKLHTDFEAGVNNLANITTYSAVGADKNILSESTYRIPGRMAIVRAIFNF